MKSRLILIPLLLMPACLEKCKEKFSIFNPLMVELILFHTPDIEGEYGVPTKMGDLTQANVYVVEVGGDGVKRGRATVELEMPDGTTIPLEEFTAGGFQASSATSPDLAFMARETYTVYVNMDGETYAAAASAFPETDIISPMLGDVIPPGQDLVITVDGDPSSTLVAIYDQNGNQVYNSFPTSSGDIVSMVTGDDGASAIIPGTALTDEGVLFLGAAGVNPSEWDDISTELNPKLSYFASGSLDAIAVSTTPWDAMGGMVWAVDGSALAAEGIKVADEVQAAVYATRITVDDGIGEAPITGCTATLAWNGQQVTLDEDPKDPGMYETDTTIWPSLGYVAGETYTFSVSDGSGDRTMSMQAPVPPVLASPAPGSYQAPGASLLITTPTSHDLFFVVVVDAAGESVYDDLPETVDTQGIVSGKVGTGPGEVIEIPGSVFTAEGILYGIGLLGLEEMTEGGASDNLNADSDMYIGTSVFTTVTTVGG